MNRISYSSQLIFNKMKCPNCDKQNPSDSNFCQKCGIKLTSSDKQPQTNDSIQANINKDKLWDKFIELYDSRDKEREKYTDLMSNEAWELISRVSVNTFEKFIETNKDQLNKQPYKIIEQIKDIFNWCVSGGYWMWYAEAFHNNVSITQMKTVSIETLKDEWSKLAFQDFSKTFESVTEELQNIMNLYHKVRVDSLMENESMKELTNETVEKLKESLIFNIIWGYSIALAESKFRK